MTANHCLELFSWMMSIGVENTEEAREGVALRTKPRLTGYSTTPWTYGFNGNTSRPVQAQPGLSATRMTLSSASNKKPMQSDFVKKERLNQFGLEIAPEKTKTLEFGPQAQKRAKERGERKAETFDFLGFTNYCTTSQSGKTFQVGRKSISKRIAAKLKLYKQWIQKNRTLPTAEIMKTTARKLSGHYAYYGVTGNSRSILNFAYEVRMLLHKWLVRRGKSGSMNFEKFNLLLKRFPLPVLW